MAAYSFGPVLKLCDDGEYKGIKIIIKTSKSGERFPRHVPLICHPRSTINNRMSVFYHTSLSG